MFATASATNEREGMQSGQPVTDRPETVGLLGAGNIGQALAHVALRAGRKVVIANSRGPASLAALVAKWLGSDPHEAGGRGVIFLSGDDTSAKTPVVELFEAAGFFPIDLGDLVTGGRMQQVGGPLPSHNLVRLPPVR